MDDRFLEVDKLHWHATELAATRILVNILPESQALASQSRHGRAENVRSVVKGVNGCSAFEKKSFCF